MNFSEGTEISVEGIILHEDEFGNKDGGSKDFSTGEDREEAEKHALFFDGDFFLFLASNFSSAALFFPFSRNQGHIYFSDL